MATTTASVAAFLSPLPPPPPVSSIFKPKPCTTFFNTTHNKFTACCLSSRKAIHFHNPISLGFPSKRYELWRRNVTSEEVLPSESTPLDTSQQIVSSSTSGDGGTASTVVSVLLFIAFVALSILTIGVVYIAVTDFLQKREREKFEKEEATKKKKGGKKMKVRARAGPRGFGQKIDDDNEEEDD